MKTIYIVYDPKSKGAFSIRAAYFSEIQAKQLAQRINCLITKLNIYD